MAAVPSIGRASAVEPRPAGPEAQATSLLYERYARQIFNFCLHRLGNREEAEDAAQTTFLNAFRGIQRGVRPELEQAWLFKIAENVCLTRHRSAFRRRRVESPSDLGVLQEVVPSPQRDADTLIRLSDALTEMPDQQRRALLLREWQGLSYREIAEELELSQPAVETLLFRARRSLASGLTEAPERKRRARLRSGLDIGGILLAFKSAFAGGAAVKIAAVAAVATTTAIAGHKVESAEHARAPKAVPAPTVVQRPAPRVLVAAAPSTSAHTEARPAAGHVVARAARPVRNEPVRTAPARRAAPSVAAPVAEQPAPSPPAVEQGDPEPQPVPAAAVSRTPSAPAEQPQPVERAPSSDASAGAQGKHKGNDKAVAPSADAPGPNGNGDGRGHEKLAAPEQPAQAESPEPAQAPEAAPPAPAEPADAAHDNGKHLGRFK